VAVRFSFLVFILIVALASCGQSDTAAPFTSRLDSRTANAFKLIGNQGLPPASGTFTSIYQFRGGNNGLTPAGLLSAGDELYGTTAYGGKGSCFGGCGTIYGFNDSTRIQTVLYSFNEHPDGSDPSASLIDLNGELYGTTLKGGVYGSGCGSDGCGTIFAFNRTTDVERVVYRFKGGDDGELPNGLVAANGRIYGTTVYGGGAGCIYNEGCGTIFSFDPKTGVENVIHHFKGNKDGANPWDRLTVLYHKFFGTTGAGGASCPDSWGCGTIFKFDPAADVETILYRFKGGSDGLQPRTGLLAEDGKLYGTTDEDGGCDGYDICGTLFEFGLLSNTEKVLHAFTGNVGGPDGAGPSSEVVALHGIIYGTTSAGGGQCRCGTIYSYDPSTNTESIVHHFDGKDDVRFPNSLIGVNGKLYGTVADGDPGCIHGRGCGTIFEFIP
jgi:uncharacterized repeat protein (TIGR03803 family)